MDTLEDNEFWDALRAACRRVTVREARAAVREASWCGLVVQFGGLCVFMRIAKSRAQWLLAGLKRGRQVWAAVVGDAVYLTPRA